MNNIAKAFKAFLDAELAELGEWVVVGTNSASSQNGDGGVLARARTVDLGHEAIFELNIKYRWEGNSNE